MLVKSLGGAETRLVESEQTVLLKENCIKALMVEKEKCIKELMFEKKMTAELDVLRERIVLMQGHNDAMVESLGETETKLGAAKLENMEKRNLIKGLTFELNAILGEAKTSLVDSRQTVLMKENSITALMAEKEMCNKELMYETKMTVERELNAVRGRMVLMQGSISNL